MGVGVSKGPVPVGAPKNPRVQYSHQLEKKEHKKLIVDAPVLVDVEHGSVRYRENQNCDQPIKSLKGKEIPYENNKGKELDNKENYFYHTRLNSYGSESSKDKEDAFKFYYILKGPASAQSKKLFYVYGQGFNAKDGRKIKPTETPGFGKDYAWSSTKAPNCLYYTLTYIGSKVTENTEEDKILSDLEPTPDKSSLQMLVNSEDRVSAIKARIAMKLLKSPKDIFIAHENRELRDDDVLGNFQPENEKETENNTSSFEINLTLI